MGAFSCSLGIVVWPAIVLRHPGDAGDVGRRHRSKIGTSASEELRVADGVGVAGRKCVRPDGTEQHLHGGVWYTSDVALTWTVVDPESPIAASLYSVTRRGIPQVAGDALCALRPSQPF